MRAFLCAAFAQGVPVVFCNMTAAHKKALMLPRIGIATPGDSKAVMILAGKYADYKHPGIVIESNTFTGVKQSPQTHPIPKQAAARKGSQTDPGRDPQVGAPASGLSAPSWFAARVRDAVDGNLLSRAVGDDPADSGIYVPPSGARYFAVLLIGGGNPTQPEVDSDHLWSPQTMNFSVSWWLYAFDDSSTNGTALAHKILITTIGQSQATATQGQWSQNHNPDIGNPNLGLWLGKVEQAYFPYDNYTSLVTSAPNSSQNQTSYTSSVSATAGLNFSGDSVSPAASFTIGTSTSSAIQDWVVLQTNPPMASGSTASGAVLHAWEQNSPFNVDFADRGGDASNFFGFGDGFHSLPHLQDLPALSNGNATLTTKNAAIYQTRAGGPQTVTLNPVFNAYLYHYWVNGFDYTITPYEFTYSPGVLQIDTGAVDALPAIQSIEFNNTPNGIWSIPINTGAADSLTVRLNYTPTQNTLVTLTHYVDTVYPDPVGVTWTPNVPEPNGKTTTVTVPAGQNFVIVPIYSTAATGSSNAQGNRFFVTIVGSVGSRAGQETTGVVEIRPTGVGAQKSVPAAGRAAQNVTAQPVTKALPSGLSSPSPRGR
jgi:hypothetical protein